MTPPFRLGLTGSIGMGKSTTARMFGQAGCAIWDADGAVHRLYAPGGAAVAPIGAIRPSAIFEGGISRDALKAWIGEDPAAFAAIEAVVHPLVAEDRARAVANCDADIIVFDIPLLFETGAETDCDAVAVVSAPAGMQRQRVLQRLGMTAAQFEAILARQMPDAEKRARANYVIPTTDLETAKAAVASVVSDIRGRNG